MNTKIYKPWIRELIVRFSYSKNSSYSISYGEAYKQNKDDYTINVNIQNFPSTLSDICTITIKNITYNDLIRIIGNKIYSVKVICGYRNGNTFTAFQGGVTWISHTKENVSQGKTYNVKFLCASELVASYQQKRLNLTFNSGINMYAALNYICQRNGITASIDESLREKVINTYQTYNDTIGNIVDNIASESDTLIPSGDSTEGVSFSLISAASGSRVFVINNQYINVQNNYPELTTDNGLELSIMPIQKFKCGDAIKIDNTLINITEISQSEKDDPGKSLDGDGIYIIYKISYSLQNRGSNFDMNLKCRPRSYFTNYINS